MPMIAITTNSSTSVKPRSVVITLRVMIVSTRRVPGETTTHDARNSERWRGNMKRMLIYLGNILTARRSRFEHDVVRLFALLHIIAETGFRFIRITWG